MFSKSSINTRAEPYNGPHSFGVGVNGSEEKGEDKKKVSVAFAPLCLQQMLLWRSAHKGRC